MGPSDDPETGPSDACALVERFFELVDADRFDEARRLVAASVVTFPLYRTSQPVLRGAAPMMERLRVLRAEDVVFDYEHFDDLGDGYVIARGTIRAPDHSEPSILLTRVVDGQIVTAEAHHSITEAHRTVGGQG